MLRQDTYSILSQPLNNPLPGSPLASRLGQESPGLQKSSLSNINLDELFPNKKGGLDVGKIFKSAGSLAGKGLNVIGQFGDTMSVFNKGVDKSALSVRNSISSAIASINPVIGGAIKAIDMIGDLTGLHADTVDKNAAKRFGVNVGFNNALGYIPVVNTLAGAFTGSATDKAYGLNPYGEEIESSYSSSGRDIAAAQKMSGKHMISGKSAANRAIGIANSQAGIMNELGRTNTLAKRSDMSAEYLQNWNNNINANQYNTASLFSKEGGRLISRKQIQIILNKKKNTEDNTGQITESLKNGGIIGTDTNLLPEGQLHARLHHLDEVNPELEDVTRKGIPVLDGNGEQVAEIEKEELIIRLEVTKKLEELMKDGSDEALIEAGKLLAEELIENTEDNTGQITEEVENG